MVLERIPRKMFVVEILRENEIDKQCHVQTKMKAKYINLDVLLLGKVLIHNSFLRFLFLLLER